MSHIEDIVDALENKMSKVLHQLEVLKQTNAKLSQELQASQEQIIDQAEALAEWQDKYEALKMAKTIQGSDKDKRETKLKINTLIREIDHCIGQLSK